MGRGLVAQARGHAGGRRRRGGRQRRRPVLEHQRRALGDVLDGDGVDGRSRRRGVGAGHPRRPAEDDPPVRVQVGEGVTLRQDAEGPLCGPRLDQVEVRGLLHLQGLAQVLADGEAGLVARHALLADEGGGLRRRRREGRNAAALALEAHGGRGTAERLAQGGVGDAPERLAIPVDPLGARRRRSGAASGADVLDNDCDGGRLRGLLGDLLGRSGLRCGRGGGLGNDCDGLIAPPRLGQGLAEVPADGGGHEPRAALLVAGHPAQALLQGHVGGAPALPAVIGEPPALVRRAPTVRPTAERR